MPRYLMQVYCNDCSQSHPTFVFELPEEIESNQCVAELYKGREVPSTIAMILSNSLTCPNTGGNYGDEASRAYLIKVSDEEYRKFCDEIAHKMKKINEARRR